MMALLPQWAKNGKIVHSSGPFEDVRWIQFFFKKGPWFSFGFQPTMDQNMDWKYCSNQFTLCIPHTNRKSFCSGYYFQIIYLYEQLLYGCWPLYKMHKELFDTLLKGPNHLLPFFSFCQQKIWISRNFFFFFPSISWNIEELKKVVVVGGMQNLCFYFDIFYCQKNPT